MRARSDRGGWYDELTPIGVGRYDRYFEDRYPAKDEDCWYWTYWDHPHNGIMTVVPFQVWDTSRWGTPFSSGDIPFRFDATMHIRQYDRYYKERLGWMGWSERKANVFARRAWGWRVMFR